MKAIRPALLLAVMLAIGGLLVSLTPENPTGPVSIRIRMDPIPVKYRSPVFLADPHDGTNRLFVVEKRGVIKPILDGVPSGHPFLDIRELVHDTGAEQGLLSIAFHPEYRSNATFFVAYTDQDDNVVVARYHARADKPNKADPASARILLSIEKPYQDHNSGQLMFGPDGYLHIGIGDGGGLAEADGNAQRVDNLLGKILRIDVDAGTDAMPYIIPPDNPFVASESTRGEIWAYGLRNPWRFSFDRQTGVLYIGDVGAGGPEEINRTDLSSPGLNFGWNVLEGDRCMRPEQATACETHSFTGPIHTYEHAEGGCAAIGGYVYRGQSLPELQGAYLFGDACTGTIWSMRLVEDEWRVPEFLDTEMVISSFAEDAQGELYVISLRGTIVRLMPGNEDEGISVIV